MKPNPYRTQCEAAGLRLPLRTRAEQPGVIYGSDGDSMITVDVDHTIGDEEADAIARLVATAVNVRAGFVHATIEEAGR